MFDLPSVTNKEMKLANKFRKHLIKIGFIMMTESVYSKLVMHKSSSDSVKKMIKNELPPKGTVQLLEITERQFSQIDYLLGTSQLKVIQSTERYIEV